MHYRRFTIMILLSLRAMYVLMHAMGEPFGNV